MKLSAGGYFGPIKTGTVWSKRRYGVDQTPKPTHSLHLLNPLPRMHRNNLRGFKFTIYSKKGKPNIEKEGALDHHIFGILSKRKEKDSR